MTTVQLPSFSECPMFVNENGFLHNLWVSFYKISNCKLQNRECPLNYDFVRVLDRSVCIR